MRSADADRPGWRTREKRRQADIEFLAWVRTASTKELSVMLKTNGLPEWRVVAIKRAIKRAILKRGG